MPNPGPGLSKTESFILIFKEVITATIALLIALTTLLLVLIPRAPAGQRG